MSILESKIPREDLLLFKEQILTNYQVEPIDYNVYDIKRGLRNADGTGVMAGVTKVCSVEGYYIQDGEKVPQEGHLTYRGYDVEEIINACNRENRFGYEEIAWLLLFGSLPSKKHLELFENILSDCRNLPDDFIENIIIIMRAPSNDIMNKMSRCVLELYSFDEDPDNTCLENIIKQSVHLIAKLPAIMAYSYQVKCRHSYKESMYIHSIKPEHSTAEAILSLIRKDNSFTHEEAKLLDLCLMVHAEHGGGNNSTFATRVLTSSGTDTYAAIAAGIGALKGPKHGGASSKVAQMIAGFKENLTDITDEKQVEDYLVKLIQKEAGDKSGLVYGMGHAVYTLSDPRAKVLSAKAGEFAMGTEFEDEYKLLRTIEKLTPQVFAELKGNTKAICANVDLYSGFVYKLLGIPQDLYTPLFAVSRIAGWSAHRIEELLTGGRIIRPAYKNVGDKHLYVPIYDR